MRFTILAGLTGLLLALCLVTARSHAPRIEADISRRVEAIVAPISTVTLMVDGRDVTLLGWVRTSSQSKALSQALASMVQAIRDLDGVRAVSADVRIIGTEERARNDPSTTRRGHSAAGIGES